MVIGHVLNFQISSTEKELKFLEALEKVCEGMMEYKLHKEKSGVSRFAKEESSTMKALNELRSRGVKVCCFFPVHIQSFLAKPRLPLDESYFPQNVCCEEPRTS